MSVHHILTSHRKREWRSVTYQYYEELYQSNPHIPTSTLGDLMKLILKENSFKFNGENYLQTHGIEMGTKMPVAFSVIFMAHIEKELLLSSRHKPIAWKIFIDVTFSVWTISKHEINSFVDFANQFHSTIKFTCEMSTRSAPRYRSLYRTSLRLKQNTWCPNLF